MQREEDMAQVNIPNEYTVELTPPDISAYREGNAGIPYVWSFDSGNPGPHALVSAVVHGNELCGAIAVDWLLASEFRPIAGKVSLAFMNVAAFDAFDPADPNASRWAEEDFNRVWAKDVLDGPRDSIELRRAREIRPVLDTVDYLLDIHSMQHKAPPLMMSGNHAKGRELAELIGVPERIVADAGHAAGKRMRDYGRFDDAGAAPAAVLIECGQHWEATAAPLAKLAAARFLVGLGNAPRTLLDGLGEPEPAQRFFRVTDVVTIETDDFRFARDFTGGEIIEEAGTVLGHDGGKPVPTPYDGCMLVMPTKRLWKGQTAVRLARRED